MNNDSRRHNEVLQQTNCQGSDSTERCDPGVDSSRVNQPLSSTSMADIAERGTTPQTRDTTSVHHFGRTERRARRLTDDSSLGNSMSGTNKRSPGEGSLGEARCNENTPGAFAVEDSTDAEGHQGGVEGHRGVEVQHIVDEGSNHEPPQIRADVWVPESTIEAELVRELIAEKVVSEKSRQKIVALSIASTALCAVVITGVLCALIFIYMVLPGWSKTPETSANSPMNSVDAVDSSFFREASRCFESRDELVQTVSRYVDVKAKMAENGETETVTKERDSIADTFGWPIGEWCTSKITSLAWLFMSQMTLLAPIAMASFNEDISRWDVSRVSNFHGVFSGCRDFNQPLNSWNVSNAVEMSSMFFECDNFNQPLNNWKVSKVTSFQRTFSFARQFNQDLAMWDVSGTGELGGMFNEAESFNGDVSRWDVSHVFDMAYTFAFARSFNQNVSSWNVHKVETLSGTFKGALQFNQDLSRWNTSSCIDISELFAFANWHPDISRWNTSKVEDMYATFDSNPVFNSDISQWDTSSVINMDNMFTEAVMFNSDISRWNTSSVKQMGGMFSGANTFNSDISNWDVSQVVKFDSMFEDATNFSQDLCAWGPLLEQSEGISVSRMFSSSGCARTSEPSFDRTPVSPLCCKCG